MGNLLTKVIINGVTIKDDSVGTPNLLINFEYERTIERGISEMDMVVLQSTNDTVALAVGQTVSVFTGFTTSTDAKMFEGFISDFSTDGGVIRIACRDKMWDLVRKIVNNVYLDTGPQAGQVSAIASDLISTFGGLTASVVASGTAIGETIAEFRCDQTDIYERLMALAKAVQYQTFYDAVNDNVKFQPRGFTDSGTTLTVGTEIIGLPKWGNDTSMMVNRLRVDGAVQETDLRFPLSGTGEIGVTTDFETAGITLPETPESAKLTIDSSDPPTTIREGGGQDSSTTNFWFMDKENKQIKPATGTTFAANDFAFVDYTWLAPAPVRERNQDSIDTFGLWDKEITLNDIQTIADAEARTAQILSRFSTPFLVGEILVKSVSTISLNVGDTITVVDTLSKPNINQNLIITKQVIKYPGSNQELTVGDEALRMRDWQFNVEERLKRLEERNLKNQDLIGELFDFANTLTTSPRYRRLFTEAYNTGNNVMIWNNPDHGIWNTDNWGTAATAFDAEADHFIQQFENSYTENFIDEDFEDSSGTASWSTTGSVTFTSGQIALSKSVDFNNGTINAATLNSTEVSGSFTYEMTVGILSSSEGPNSPGTVVDDSNIGTRIWGSPENAKISDDVYTSPAGGGTNVKENSIKIVKGGVITGEDKSTGTSIPVTETTFSYGNSTDLWDETWVPSDINNVNFGVVFSSINDFGTSHYLKATNFGFSIPTEATIKGILVEIELIQISFKTNIDHIRITVHYSTPVFETVTPGTAHTFTVTGTDLRFRITENAASTGEISQVIITNYH
ncbi:MAG: hypothetical protein KJI69_06405 [Patescibacteria group bacterium]|nr:hypothetical protein [Patescibacteria group bacterium]